MTKHRLIKCFFVFLFIPFILNTIAEQAAFADNLDGTYAFGSDTTTIGGAVATFETVASATVSTPVGGSAVLAIATFSSQPESTAAEGIYRLYDITNNVSSGNIYRNIAANSAGIGSVAYIFGTVPFSFGTIELQHAHNTLNNEVKTLGSLVTIPLTTNTGYPLSWNRTRVSGTTNGAGTFTTVGSTMTVTTPAAYTYGDFYVAASVQTNKGGTGASELGKWKLEYSPDSGTNWNDLGYTVSRIVTSNSNNNGIVNLVGHLAMQDISGGDYQFRLRHSDSGGQSVNTLNANLVAVFTGYNDTTNDQYFPTTSTHAASASTSGSSLVPAVSFSFDPRANTELFLHGQYWMETTGQSTPKYDIYADYGFGTVVFDGQDQERSLSSGLDTGSGASVGLAEGLVPGTIYNNELRHASSSAQTLTTNDPFLIGWDLSSFLLGATCPTVPPQTPTAAPGPDNALFYDGTNNYVTVADNNRLDLTNRLSMECWIKPDSVTGVQTLIGKYAAGATGVTLNLNGTNAQVSYHSSFGTLVTLTDGTTAPDFTFATCDWYHVATTFDNAGSGTGTLTLYVNGVAAESNATALAPTTNAGAMTIGQSGNSSNYFNGVIDEVKVWQNYAFGTTALRDWMCKKVTSAHPAWANLSAYYRFDENGLGATVYDYGSWGLNGTAVNFAFGTERICSSAPVGDESDHDYNGSNPGDFKATLTYTPEGDFMFASGTGGNWANAGIQLYMVDEGPNNNVPPAAWGTGYVLDPLRYWGVFVANGASPVYQIVYDWTLHQGITKDSWNSLKLAWREGNCDIPWQDLTATLNTTTRTLSKTGLTGTEFILGGNINSNDPLAITLSHFFAEIDESGKCIRISWETATEIETIGYYLWRSDSESNEYTLLTDSFMPSQAVSETTGASYSYIDCSADLDRKVYYYYKLEEVDFDTDKSNPVYGPIGPVSPTVSSVKISESFNSENDSKCFITTLFE